MGRISLIIFRLEDCPFVEEIPQKTKQGFQDLLNALDPEKYPKARTYIQNLINPVTTFCSRSKLLATGQEVSRKFRTTSKNKKPDHLQVILDDRAFYLEFEDGRNDILSKPNPPFPSFYLK